MRTLCSRTEIVETEKTATEIYEVCAAVVATHNENTGELTLTLDSFVRAMSPSGADREYRPGWLPEPCEERHAADVEDAWEETRLAFREWADKVRLSVPAPDRFVLSLSGTLASVPLTETPMVHRSAFRREV